MSVDAFGNSPAMTQQEMIDAGLIDEAGEPTAKGAELMRIGDDLARGVDRAARDHETSLWAIELEACEPESLPRSGADGVTYVKVRDEHWPILQLTGTFDALVTYVTEHWGDERNASYIAEYGVKVDTPAPAVLHVEVPGEMIAQFSDGRIIGWTFSPLGSYAGHFGPSAIVLDPTPIALDVESTDGPFWRAVQENLASADGFRPDWQE